VAFDWTDGDATAVEAAIAGAAHVARVRLHDTRLAPAAMEPRAAIGRWDPVDGRYTGEIDFYCYGENKATAVKQLAAERGYDLDACHAYSDSVTDLPMLEAVGHPTAVNPDRALRAAALDRGWPVLTFTKPVSLRSRFHAPSGTAVAVTAIGLGAIATAGATWYGLHRRRRPKT